MFRLTSVVLAALACSTLNGQPSTPVILISVDTLRADHLSCYQAGRGPTPYIDALVKDGTLFSQVSSPFPLTLPAHVALFTSSYPFTNRVEDNGIPLKAGAMTMATILKKAGYRTGAFVGSFVLDRRFGLDQGFDFYDGPLDVHSNGTAQPTDRKRPGMQVADAAMHWLERNSSTPFFLFLHLYDLHLPYDLPQNPSLRHGETGYAAELAYEDRVVGAFLAFLERLGLLQKSLIVFTSDHGEGLGDHGESTHGYYIYQSTLRVPLIIHWPVNNRRISLDRVEDAASLLDIVPTILETIGLPRPDAMRGHSLIGTGGAREIYSESLYARNHFGCSVLRSLRMGTYKYIEAPKPELYDLSNDPNELHNLYEQQRSKAGALGEQLAAMRASSASTTASKSPSPKPETANVLRSLGYLSGSASFKESGADPKDRIADFERYLNALSLASAGRLAESDGLLQKLGDKLPDVVDIRINLGLNEQRLGEYDQAARELKRATERAPSDARAHFELGFCYFHLHQLDDALQELNAALNLEPWYTRADEALADIYIQKKDYPRARAQLGHLLSIDPQSYTAHYNLGVFAAQDQNWSDAEQHMLAALHANPGSAEAHNTLGTIYLQCSQLEQARRQFEEAIRLQSNLASAHYQLGLILHKQGKNEEAAREFLAAREAEH